MGGGDDAMNADKPVLTNCIHVRTCRATALTACKVLSDAGLCMLLALGAVGRRRKPTLVTEETNTDPDPAHGGSLATMEAHDPMFYLQDSFGAVNWKQNTTYQGDQI